MEQKKTAKSKLDAALGITQDSSIDDFLESLTLENDSAKKAVDKIDETIKKEVSNIDANIDTIQRIDDFSKQSESLIQIKSSLSNIDDLITISKEIIKHIYEVVVSTELVDSEMIHAAATLIESCHLNVKEYIDLYRDRLKFCEKVQLEMLKHKNNLEILEKRHQYEMEKASQNTVDAEGGIVYNIDDITKTLKNEQI